MVKGDRFLVVSHVITSTRNVYIMSIKKICKNNVL